MEKLATFQVIGVGLDVVSRRLCDGLLLLRQQLDFQLLDNSVRDFVLDRKDVGQIAIESFRPNVLPSLLFISCPVTRTRAPAFSHAAFQHKVDAEFLADVLHLYGFAFVSERSVARDDEQAGNL